MIPASVDVVVPTFNNLEELKRCLDSIAREPDGVRVLVCIDGSTDGSLAYFSSAGSRFPIAVLQHPDGTNHGRAATRNLAVGRLEAPYTLLLDSDMELEAGAIARHLDLLTSRRCVSVGDVVYRNASTNLWARYMGTRGKNKFAGGADMTPQYLASANVAFPTDAFQAIGGFDEALSKYGGEDTELGLRFTALGLPLVFNAAARASTVEDKSLDVALRQLHEFGRYNLPLIRAAHPTLPAPFWSDRLESTRPRDRLFRLLMNPISDAFAAVLTPIAPWRVQRFLLNYRALRQVWRGYAEARRS